MARIFFVARDLDPQVQEFAKTLFGKANKVTIVTDRKAIVPEGFEIPVWTYFKRWSVPEALRLLPVLLRENIEICHFIRTKAEQKLSFAELTLAGLVRGLPGTLVASSFFSSSNSPKLLQKVFLRTQNLVTVGTRTQLLQAKRERQIARNQVFEVVPPLSSLNVQADTSLPSEHLQRLIRTLQNYLILPHPPEELSAATLLQLKQWPAAVNFLFLGHRQKELRRPTERVFTTGEVSQSEKLFAIKNSKAALLAFSELSLLELQTWLDISQSFKIPLIVNLHQIELLPGLCLHERSGWILYEGIQSLRDLLATWPRLKAPGPFDSLKMTELADSTINELQRLYQLARMKDIGA